MKTNQNGFGIFELVVFLGVIAVLGLSAWNFVRPAADIDVQSSTSVTADEANSEEPDGSILADGQIVDSTPAIEFSYVEDIDRLPEYAPASFRTYLEDFLSRNSRDSSCIFKLSISKISNVNILGTRAATNIKGNNRTDPCGNNDGVVWYLFDNKWNIELEKALIECEFFEERKIYKEFMKVCLEFTPEPIAVPNPNGSITQLKRQ